jgi:hypothetical protein
MKNNRTTLQQHLFNENTSCKFIIWCHVMDDRFVNLFYLILDFFEYFRHIFLVGEILDVFF